jgi:hypothetical protein
LNVACRSCDTATQPASPRFVHTTKIAINGTLQYSKAPICSCRAVDCDLMAWQMTGRPSNTVCV